MKTLKEALVDVKRLGSDDQDQEPEIDLTIDDDESTDDTELDRSPKDGEQDEVDIDLETDDDAPTSDPAPANADADSPWGSLPGGGGGAGDGPAPDADPAGEEPTDPESESEIDAVASEASEDPDRQGLIRTVRGAHLIYKRESESGTFDELWIYNVSTLQDEMTVRKAILAGTDIPPNKASSPDGSQTYKIWSAGNAEMLLVTGLQN